MRKRPAGKVHFIGMGGIGMSAVAQLMMAQGARVSGSDSSDNALLRRIRGMGGKVFLGHGSKNLNHPDLVVYSSAIMPQNPELIAARNRGIPVLHRGQLLAKLVAGRRTIAVAGSHGKSTTTGLVGQLLLKAGLDPTLALGAEVEALGGNARTGQGRYAVVEADESDGSFLWLQPAVAILTNIDDEHLDYFRNRSEIEKAYAAFAERIVPQGTLIGCADDPSVRRLLSRSSRRRLSYGLSKPAEIRAMEIHLEAGRSRYQCVRAGRTLGSVRLQIPGLHNVLNSLGVVAVAEVLGIPFRTTQTVLEEYHGAKRRFQVHAEVQGVMVVEDYGHHPAEIQATLQAARSWPGRRIRCLFQPHRYSRTHFLLKRFASSFEQADEVLLLPIYAASEEPVEGITARALYRALREGGHKKVKFCSSVQEALGHLQKGSRPGDMVLFLGAGSVGKLAGQFVQRLKDRRDR